MLKTAEEALHFANEAAQGGMTMDEALSALILVKGSVIPLHIVMTLYISKCVSRELVLRRLHSEGLKVSENIKLLEIHAQLIVGMCNAVISDGISGDKETTQ